MGVRATTTGRRGKGKAGEGAASNYRLGWGSFASESELRVECARLPASLVVTLDSLLLGERNHVLLSLSLSLSSSPVALIRRSLASPRWT